MVRRLRETHTEVKIFDMFRYSKPSFESNRRAQISQREDMHVRDLHQVRPNRRTGVPHHPQTFKGKHFQGNQPKPPVEQRGKEVWRRKGVAESSKQGEERNTKLLETQEENIHTIDIHPSRNGWLLRTFLGRMRRLTSAMEMEEIFKREKIRDIKIKPIGGRYLIITFPDVKERDEAFKEKWLELWLDEIKPWSEEAAKIERFVWLVCLGMPLNAWNVPTSKDIGNKWAFHGSGRENTKRGVL